MLDSCGIHHRLLNAVVETEPGTDCYGIMDVFSDRIELRGVGNLVSAVMPWKLPTSTHQTEESQQLSGKASANGVALTAQAL